MATPLSEVITYLSLDGVVAVGQSFETIKTVLQEFGSMSITVVSDQNLSFRISFSNDSINFDYNSNTSVEVGEPVTITSVILGKWCKLRALNAGPSPANVRFQTYCQIIPIATQSQIEKEGDTFPSVNVNNLTGTLFNDLRTSERKPIYDHKFDYTTIVTDTIVTPDRTLLQRSGGGIITTISKPFVAGNVLSLGDIYRSPLGSFLEVSGPPIIYTSGNPLYIEMGVNFNIAGYDDPIANGVDQMMVGLGYVDPTTNNIIDGIYLGYPATPIPPDTVINEMSLVFYGEGQEFYIKRSNWIFDRLDGNGPSKILLDETKLSTWRIRAAQMASVYLEYHQPFDNEWTPCHRIEIENNRVSTGYKNPSLGFNIYTKRTTASTGAVGSNLSNVGVAEGVVGVEVGQDSLGRVQTYGIESPNTAILAGVESVVLSFRAGPILNTKLNRALMVPRNISFSADGTKSVTFRVYRDVTFVAPVWTALDNTNTPIERLTGGSVTLPSGYTIVGYYTSKDSTSHEDFNAFNVNMDNGESLTVTAESINNSLVRTFVNYALID